MKPDNAIHAMLAFACEPKRYMICQDNRVLVDSLASMADVDAWLRANPVRGPLSLHSY